MLIMGIFEQRIELEQALADMEHSGIGRSSIMVVPLDRFEGEPFRYMEWTSRAFEVGMACTTAGSVIGVCTGFVLDWGPVIWGLIWAVGGFTAGYGIYSLLHKQWRSRGKASIKPEVAVIVRGSEEMSGIIRKLMWEYRAISVGRIPDGTSGSKELKNA
jgi:hypothetical protein